MEKANVYFTDFRVQVGTSLLQKLKTLCIAAGIKKIDMEGKFVAIKMHFGELGNMASSVRNMQRSLRISSKSREVFLF